MTIRLNKVTRDLNVGITTVVEFLQKKGYTIEANPNTKITEEQYAVLVKEFSTDKNLKKESEKFIQERQNKDRNKPTVAIEGTEEPKKEEEIDLRPSVKFKPVGKIDLDNLNKRSSTPKVEEPVKDIVEEVSVEPEPEIVAPVLEDIKPEPEKVEPIIEEVEEPKEPMEKERPENNHTPNNEEDGVFKIRPTEFKSGINVLGKIDLDALNQSTRPKKKSKEEKRKERDEKEKLRQQQRQQMKDAIIKEIRKTDDKNKDGDDEGGKKKKRNRIGKERVDINAPSNQGGQRKEGHPGKNNNQGNQGKPGKDQAKPNKARFKKPAPKVEVSDEDVAKQVKETLARLTNKTKNKAAKYRKEKRDNVRDRMMEQEEMEQEESKILKLTEFVTANELANMMDIPVTQVIGTCMSIGMMVSINQRLDAETINLVA